MVIFQTEESRKSLLLTATACAVLLILFFLIRFAKTIPVPLLDVPEIVTITPDPPLPMPELKDNAGGKSNTPTPNPGNKDAGSPKVSQNPQPSQKETAPVKGSDVQDNHAASAPRTTENTKPKIRTMGSTSSPATDGQDDFGNSTNASSNVNGTNGGIQGEGSPYGAGESKIPGAFNNKLPSDVDFAGAVYVKLKVGADGIPVEFIKITRSTDLNPSLKASIIADIKNKLRNLRCKPHSSEYTEEFKFVYKKS